GEPMDDVKLGRVRADLESLWRGETTAAELLARKLRSPSWAKRHSPDVPTEVQVDNDASPRFTVIDVFTRDRAALLHAIARTLYEQGLSIGISKVNTEGERAADVFYVVGADGKKVDDRDLLASLPGLLKAAIEGTES
ncbi:MAG TPA: hypothetical protein DEF51_14220, partial [Myxococcales bacterium]|nr:hypothetical protein [Myxococcales bacterium]